MHLRHRAYAMATFGLTPLVQPHATFLAGITHDTVSPENTPSGIKNDTTSELNPLKSLAFVSWLHKATPLHHHQGYST